MDRAVMGVLLGALVRAAVLVVTLALGRDRGPQRLDRRARCRLIAFLLLVTIAFAWSALADVGSRIGGLLHRTRRSPAKAVS